MLVTSVASEATDAVAHQIELSPPDWLAFGPTQPSTHHSLTWRGSLAAPQPFIAISVFSRLVMAVCRDASPSFVSS
jgi:hypothetical protein